MNQNQHLAYKTREQRIEAIQMSEDRINSNADWLNEAWRLDARSPGSVYLHHSEPRRLALMSDKGPVLIDENDWIINDAKGLAIMDYVSFQEIYEPA